MADTNFATAAQRPGPGVTAGEQPRDPLAIVKVQAVNPRIAGSQQALPGAAVPGHRINGVQDSPGCVADCFSSPCTWPIQIDRDRIAFHRRESLSDHWPQEQHLAAGTIRVYPPEPVGCRHAINLAHSPWLAHVFAMRQDSDITDAFFGA